MGFTQIGGSSSSSSNPLQINDYTGSVQRSNTTSANGTQTSLGSSAVPELFVGWNASPSTGQSGTTRIVGYLQVASTTVAYDSLMYFQSGTSIQELRLGHELTVPIYLPAGASLSFVVSYGTTSQYQAWTCVARYVTVSSLRTSL